MPPAADVVPMVAARDFAYLAPVMILTIWGLVVLLADLCWFRRRSDAERRLGLGLLGLAGVLLTLITIYVDAPTFLGVAYETEDPSLFFGTLSGDRLTVIFNALIVALLGLVIAVSMAWSFTNDWGEYFALLFWAGVGMMLLIASEELLTLFLTLEMMTICLYLASAFETNRRRSPEAGLKYFVYGSVSSALFLFGLSLVYGLTGTTRLDAIHQLLIRSGGGGGLTGNLVGATASLLILVGIGFKIAAVPFHQWAPDAYEGAPAPVTAWIASGSKVASFVALMKIFSHALGAWSTNMDDLSSPGWMGVFAVVAALSMTYGNFAALAQRNFKRMLAYSSIAHAGYLLVGVLAVSVRPSNQQAAAAVLFYLIVYSFTTVGGFAVAAWLARDIGADDIDDLNGLGYKAPALAVCVVLLMLSLIGIPPMGGFIGKLYMFLEAMNSNESGKISLTWLVALALAMSVVSAFYYVRVLRAMFLCPPGRRSAVEAPACIRWPILISTVVVLVLGIYPAPLMEILRGAAIPALMMNARTGLSDNAVLIPHPMIPDSPPPPSVPAAR